MIRILRTWLKGKDLVNKNILYAIEKNNSLPDYDFSPLFSNTIKKYYISLSANNNLLIKSVLKNKSFIFLDVFWKCSKVKNRLLKHDLDIYLFCKKHYDFQKAIENNDIEYIKEILNTDITNTLLDEIYFKEKYFMLAVSLNHSAIVNLFLSKTNFYITFSEFNIFKPLIENEYTESLIATLNAHNWEFSKMSKKPSPNRAGMNCAS